MAEEKTYVFGEGAGNNGILSLLGPMLSQRGVDPNVLLAMQGRNNDGFGEGGWFIWVIFLFFLMGWGGNGFGNNGAGGLGNQLNNDYGREMLLQAINGNGNAISQLATTLNCDINAVQSAINSVQSQIQSVGNQVGMSGQQVINAIQAGNCQIASQIASCSPLKQTDSRTPQRMERSTGPSTPATRPSTTSPSARRSSWHTL